MLPSDGGGSSIIMSKFSEGEVFTYKLKIQGGEPSVIEPGIMILITYILFSIIINSH